MASPASLKLVCVIVMCMLMFAPHARAAISCGSVASQLAGCVSYLKGAPDPSRGCCDGVRLLHSMTRTLAERRVACKCLTTAARAIRGLNYGKAASLPRRCGVSIPYAISPHTNCNAVH